MRALAAARAAALGGRQAGEVHTGAEAVLTPRERGQELVDRAAFQAGLVGAATGTLSLVSLPIGLPAGVALTLAQEAKLLRGLLEIYGLDAEGEKGKLKLYALWLGAGFADAAKSAGLHLGANAIGRALAGSLPARLIAKLNPVLLKAILARIGLGWIPRLLKLWPIVGAPIGFVVDRAALRALGAEALDTLDRRVRAPVERPRSKPKQD